jgi:type VI secretion system protein ImpJ
MVRPKDLAAGTAAGFSAEGISNAWFLHCVNAAISPLRHLLMQQTAHPEDLYVEMSRLAGALCTFGLDSHPSTLPRYQHGNLTKVFNDLDVHIRTHLELIVPSNCVRLPVEEGGAVLLGGGDYDERCFRIRGGSSPCGRRWARRICCRARPGW